MIKKGYYIVFSTLILLLTIVSTNAQDLIFSEAPEHYRLYACNQSNSAQVQLIDKVKGKKNVFLAHGYEMLDSTLHGIPFKLVFPKKANEQRNWIWRARFWGHQPQTDLALLKKGFHVAYIDVAGLFGNEEAISRWDKFYEFLTKEYHLNDKVVLEGMSRGGLVVFNWANRNADKVACIYADAPVCDFKSWPAGKGSGKGAPNQWKTCLHRYGLSEVIALKYNGNPVDHLEYLASHKVPILSVVGETDEVVPVSENTALLEKRLKTLGWKMTIINKPGVGHHPHSLEDPKPIVDFILKHSTKSKVINKGVGNK